MQTCLGTAIENEVQSTNTTHWLHGPLGISSKWISYIACTPAQTCSRCSYMVICKQQVTFNLFRRAPCPPTGIQHRTVMPRSRGDPMGISGKSYANSSETRNRDAEMLLYAR